MTQGVLCSRRVRLCIMRVVATTLMHWCCCLQLPLVLLLAATMRAPSKDSLLAAWLMEDGCIQGLPREAVADLRAYERWCVATKPAAQAAVAVKKEVQRCKLYWLNANTVKGAQVVHQSAGHHRCASRRPHRDIHAKSDA